MSVQVKSSGSSPTLQSRTVTPSSSTQYITAQTGYDALSQVTVQGDSNLVSSNIKNGVNIFGVSGSLQVGEYKVNFWEKKKGGSNGYNIFGSGTSAKPYKIDLYSTFTWSNGEDVGNNYQIRAFCCAIEFTAGVSIMSVYNSQTTSDNLTFQIKSERISGTWYYTSDWVKNAWNWSSDKTYITLKLTDVQDYLNGDTSVDEIKGYYLFN